MKLYKYRSTARLDHILDIILNERLYCAPYKELNDPFEGLFSTQMRLDGPLFLSPRSIERFRGIDDLHWGDLPEWRICSLSSDPEEVRLWSLYADSLRGIVIEIDCSNMEDVVRPVVYTPSLKQFGSTILAQPYPTEVLGYKTKHWEYEAEYRIVVSQSYHPVTGRISGILCGTRMGDEMVRLFRKITPPAIPVFRTELDPKELKIRRGTEISQ